MTRLSPSDRLRLRTSPRWCDYHTMLMVFQKNNSFLVNHSGAKKREGYISRRNKKRPCAAILIIKKQQNGPKRRRTPTRCCCVRSAAMSLQTKTVVQTKSNNRHNHRHQAHPTLKRRIRPSTKEHLNRDENLQTECRACLYSDTNSTPSKETPSVRIGECPVTKHQALPLGNNKLENQTQECYLKR
jgi:hypothetical protein